jgi:hypothetical protein
MPSQTEQHLVNSDDFPLLQRVLEPYLPQSLTVLGYLERAAWTSTSLHVWSSFPIYEPPPEHFAIAAYAAKDQIRVFSSLEYTSKVGDSSTTPATPEEEDFMLGFMRACVDNCYDVLRTTDLGLGPELELKSGTGDFAGSSSLLFGSVHDKWSRCLAPFAYSVNPCVKFVLSPEAAVGFAFAGGAKPLPEGFSAGPLEDEDLDLVIAHSHIPRTRAYLKRQAHQSICIRAEVTRDQSGASAFGAFDAFDNGDGDAEVVQSNMQQPVAWCLRHADGSFGTMQVVDEFKRRGLAKEVTRRLVELQLRMAEDRDKDKESRAGARVEHAQLQNATKGWYWVDVMCSNEEGMGFYGKLPGWEKGWVSSWMSFGKTLFVNTTDHSAQV